MAVTKPLGKLTYEDLATLPDDGKRYELIEGELWVAPAPGSMHQRISRRLLYLLDAEAVKIGAEVLYAPLDVFLTQDSVVEPDLLLLTSDRRHLIVDRGVEGAPDLVVEILSPATSKRDQGVKASLYARAGVREYWLVSPEAATIEVLVLGEQGYSVHLRAGRDEAVSSTVLPELSFPASEAFKW